MSNDRYDTFVIQRGNTSTLHVSNQERYYLVREEWRGRQLLNSVIVSAHRIEAEAQAARKEHATS